MVDLTHGPEEFTTFEHKHDEGKIAMPVLSIYRKLEYIFTTADGLASKTASWENFYLEYEQSSIDLTDKVLAAFKEGSTPRAVDLMIIYFREKGRPEC
jgi:predicted PolB exonuclease-like 3'-5' exonuclease